MKSFIQISFCFCLLYVTVNAQWFWQNPLRTGNMLMSIKTINSTAGSGIVQWGKIVNNTNRRTSWIPETNFYNEKNELYQVQNGNIFRSSTSSFDTTSGNADITEKSLYVIRFVPTDTLNNLSFYGISLGGVHENKIAKFSGLALCFSMGNPPLQGKSNNDISINGINISLFMTGITGNINGFAFGGFWGTYAEVVNGCVMGLIGAGSNYLNGLSVGGYASGGKIANGIAIGGIGSLSERANGIQIGGAFNKLCNFNGIGISTVNSAPEYDCPNSIINGLILGVYNAVSVNGLSFGVINNGKSWIQVGLLNMGDSVVQVGLVNLDANKKIKFPFINVNF